VFEKGECAVIVRLFVVDLCVGKACNHPQIVVHGMKCAQMLQFL
jgi:hypothetical protein